MRMLYENCRRHQRYVSLHLRVLLFATVAGGCFWPACICPAQRMSEAELRRAELTAEQVTIYRDSFGVPHVYGPTDAAVVFGFTFARAEDEFQRIQRSLLMGMGRVSESIGATGYLSDRAMRLFEVPKHAQAEFENCDDAFKQLLQAYSDALNYYVITHPNEADVIIDRFEPWHVLAAGRSTNVAILELSPEYPFLLAAANNAVRPDSSKQKQRLKKPKPKDERDGSNMWAIGPTRSSTGNAMLFCNPHIPLNEVYEGHLHSEQGLNVSGGFAYGTFMFPFAGHNESVGWSLTVNTPDVLDVYLETFDHPDDKLMYRWNAGWRKAETWTETIKIRNGKRLVDKKIECLKTHHGPVFIQSGETGYAIRIAKIREGGLQQQFYQMARSRNLDEFKQAVARGGLIFHNIMYADIEGNIWYCYSGAMPRRDASIDWNKPVTGSDLKTNWNGYHELSDLPQILNPTCGWMQNCNSSPFTTVADQENLVASDFVNYIGRRDKDDNRVRISKKILSRAALFSFEDWAAAAWDTYVIEADVWIPQIQLAFQNLDASNEKLREQLGPLVNELDSWDRRCAINSTAATLFHLWYEKTRISDRRPEVEPAVILKKLLDVKDDLEASFDKWRVPYGEMFRHQRPDDRGEFAGDDGVSFPTAGGNALAGMVFTFLTRRVPGSNRRYGFHGHSYVSVIEFDPKGIKTRSMVPFGQSRDPSSKHYLDQAPMYANGQFKTAWFTLSQIKSNSEPGYSPGQRKN